MFPKQTLNCPANRVWGGNIVTSTNLDGKHILIQADRAKTKSSLRTLPLVDTFVRRLRALKEQQEYNERVCGNCYKIWMRI